MFSFRSHKGVIPNIDYMHYKMSSRIAPLIPQFQRMIAVFSTEFQEHQVKLSLAVLDALADVYKEFQGISFEFDQYMKKINTHYEPTNMRLKTEVIRVYNRGNMQLKQCWRGGECTNIPKEVIDDSTNDMKIEYFCIRFLRNGIIQPVQIFDRYCRSDNVDYEKFDKHEFKRVVRHIMRMRDANDTIKINNTSEVNPDHVQNCVWSGPKVHEKFVFQYLANFYPDIPMYELYDEQKYSNYTLSCRAGDYNSSISGVVDQQQLNKYIHMELELRYPHYYDYLKSSFDSQTYNTSTLLYVRSNSTTPEEQLTIHNMLTDSMNELQELRKQHPEIGSIEFAYADYEDIDEDYKEMLQDLEEPFVVLIEPATGGGGGLSFYHLYPGRCCINEMDFTQKPQNASQITAFVRRFYSGHLMPLLPNENITETMASNSTLRDFILAQSANWTFINAQQLDRIARDPTYAGFMVMACELIDPQCQFNFNKVREIAWLFGHRVKLYFMDITKNKLYLRGQHQKFLLDDFKIGMYFKTKNDLWHPEPWYHSQALDGLISFQSTEMNMFYTNLRWLRDFAKQDAVDVYALPYNVLQNLDKLLGQGKVYTGNALERLPV